VSKNVFRQHLKKSSLIAVVLLLSAIEFAPAVPVMAQSEASSEAGSEAPRMLGGRGRRRWYYQQMRQQQQQERRQLQQQQRSLNQQNRQGQGQGANHVPHMQIKRWNKGHRNNNNFNNNNSNYTTSKNP
jgi:hypothetical protein